MKFMEKIAFFLLYPNRIRAKGQINYILPDITNKLIQYTAN